MIEKAIKIAVTAHQYKVDKVGKPYILHLLRVMQKGKTETEKICGVLHDLVEDTEWTFEKLKEEGFSSEVIKVLDCITRREGESYDNFINRISKNPIAVRVKINDLEDNMDITRLNRIVDEDIQRLNKYLKAYHYLKSI